MNTLIQHDLTDVARVGVYNALHERVVIGSDGFVVPVFESVPEGQAKPYIVPGPANLGRTDSPVSQWVVLQLDGWSTYQGYAEIEEIKRKALEALSLYLADAIAALGHRLVWSELETATTFQEPKPDEEGNPLMRLLIRVRLRLMASTPTLP